MVMMMMMFYFAPRIFVVFIPPFNSAVHWALFLSPIRTCFSRTCIYASEQNNSLICLILIFHSYTLLFLHIQHFADSNIRTYTNECVLHRRWVCARVHIGLSILHVSSFMFLLSYSAVYTHWWLSLSLLAIQLHWHTQAERKKERERGRENHISFSFCLMNWTLCWCHSVHLQR